MSRTGAMVNENGTLNAAPRNWGDDKVETFDWNRDLGPRGLRRLVPLTLLRVDREYQRAQNPKKIYEIARNFAWAAFGSLTVSLRADGTYFVMDGGHRACAAATRGDIKQVPCEVFQGLTQAQEAAAFVAINSMRRPPSGIEVFVADLVAKNPAAIAAKKLLKQHNIEVNKGGGPNALGAILTFQSLNGDRETLLRFLDEVWPEEPDRLRADMLKGVVAFAATLRETAQKDLLDPDVVRKFQACSLVALRQGALALARLDGLSTTKAIRCAMVQHWNKGRRTRRIPLELGA